MTAAASPWDALLNVQHAVRLQAPRASAAPEPKPATKTAGLLELLAHSPGLTTLALAFEADLTPNQVWGLLKDPRGAGQVTYDGGRWESVVDFPGRDVMRAAELLRRKGWTVEPPEAA